MISSTQPTSSPASTGSFSKAVIIKLGMKLEWLQQEEKIAQNRFLQYKSLTCDSPLILYLNKEIFTVFGYLLEAIDVDIELARNYSKTLLDMINLQERACSSALQHANEIKSDQHSVIHDIQVCELKARFFNLNYTPECEDDLKQNQLKMDQIQKDSDTFYENYKKANYSKPYLEAFFNEIPKFKSTQIIIYQLHFLQSVIQSMMLKKSKAESVALALSVIKELKLSANATNNPALLQFVDKLQYELEFPPISSPRSPSNTSSASTSTTSLLSQLAPASALSGLDLKQLRIEAEREHYQFNLVPLPEKPYQYDANTKLVLLFDIDGTLCYEDGQVKINLIALDKLLHFLANLKPGTEVYACSSRYFPEDNKFFQIQYPAIEVIELIHKLLKKPVFSGVIYTSANTKLNPAEFLFRKHLFYNISLDKNQIALIDNLQLVLDDLTPTGFKTILADTNGIHFNELYTFARVTPYKATPVVSGSNNAIPPTLTMPKSKII